MTKRMVRRVVTSQKPDILFLKVTKCEDPKEGFVRSVWGSSSMGWVGKASEGAFGGVLSGIRMKFMPFQFRRCRKKFQLGGLSSL